MARGSSNGMMAVCVGLLAVAALAAGLWVAKRPSNGVPESGTPIAGTTRAQEPPTAGSELEIAVEDAAAPWSQADGTGCANDIVVAAYRAVSVPIRFKVVPYARAKEMAMSGEAVACFAMSWSPELEGKIVFADADKPLYICRATYVLNVKMPVKAGSEKELASGTKVGTVINYEYPASVTGLAGRGVVFDAATSEEANLKKLVLGRIDLAIINIDDLKTADLLFAKAGVTGQVAVAFAAEAMPSHIGFSVANPRGEFARKKFNAGYAIIKENGTLEKIYRRWRDK